MKQNWLISISLDQWNSILKNQTTDIFSIPKISFGDILCIYVHESSSIKGIAKLSNKLLDFQKTGEINYFGIADSLEFVKDKENVVKYLKNFGGIANLGKPIPPSDVEFIKEHMIADIEPNAFIESEIPLDNNFPTGSDYEKMFKLENTLREFIVTKLESVSKNWVKERAPDQEAVKKWIERQNEQQNQNKWLNTKNNYKLIEFSDFHDLITLVITRKNWKDCFENVFDQRTIFEGKMIELSKIRNDLAHNRILSQMEKDALDLYSRQIFKLLELR